MRGLPQKLACICVEDSFMRRRAVTSNQTTPCSQRMPHGDVTQHAVAGLASRIEDKSDVHHNVDEQRLVRDKRSEILALLLKPQGERLARLHQNLVEPHLRRQLIPAKVCRKKNKPEIV